MSSDGADRGALRTALRDAYPWIDETEMGPRAVEAGECDRCGSAPRLLPTCGPASWVALCRTCATEVGDDAWCDGHDDDGRAMRAWADTLPEEWPAVVRLWWVATGEVRLDPALLDALRARLPRLSS